MLGNIGPYEKEKRLNIMLLLKKLLVLLISGLWRVLLLMLGIIAIMTWTILSFAQNSFLIISRVMDMLEKILLLILLRNERLLIRLYKKILSVRR